MQTEYATRQKTRAVTANTTLTRGDLGTLVHNTGAAGAVTVTLPKGNTDDTFEFYVATGQDLVVDPGAGAVFSRTGGATTAGQTLTNGTVGGVLRIVCVAANTWAVTRSTGTWTAA